VTPVQGKDMHCSLDNVQINEGNVKAGKFLKKIKAVKYGLSSQNYASATGKT
jgi:hypothetical protein